MPDTTTENRQKITNLVGRAKVGMLTTMTADGKQVSRPMGLQKAEFDRQKAEQLYTPTVKAWFPEGLDTPGLTLIKVEADTAEYWEGPTSTAAWVLGNLRAAVTKGASRDPIRNDTVDL